MKAEEEKELSSSKARFTERTGEDVSCVCGFEGMSFKNRDSAVTAGDNVPR